MSDYSDSTYDTTSYDTTSYETTSYTPTYDTGYTPTYDTSSAYETAFDNSGYVETGSYSYDATSWGDVADVSQNYYDSYYAETAIADSYWDLSTQAYLEGDSYAAYNLNQMSIDWSSQADSSWDTGNDVWTSMAETATVTTWEPAYDTSWSAAPVDTSWSAAPVDTSWSAAPVDTSWSAADTSTTE
jgi:hypothetical protein